MEITRRDFSGGGEGRNGGKRYREEEAWLVGIRQMGRDKNGIGNRELKELICTTHGHELSGLGGVLKGWRVQGRGRKRGKN